MNRSSAPDPIHPDVRAFLQELRRRTNHVEPKTQLHVDPEAALREVHPDEDLVARFLAAAEKAGCVTHSVLERDPAEAVRALVADSGLKRVVIEPQPETALDGELAERLRAALTTAGVQVTRLRDDETLFSTGAAITGVRAAIAETGTLVCLASSQSARGTSLIPPMHIAIVDARQLHADLFDFFAWLARQGELPSNVNLITGPSKTADIEGVLVTGVHGPGVVHVVLIA